jgi:putative endonuclease
MTTRRATVGQDGEQQAANWYEANGYEVMARNWACREGEIDLVCRRNRTIVFCEVKTRSSTAFGTPAEAVTHAKRARVRAAAAQFLATSPVRPVQIRFDVVGVLDGELTVYQGAF